MLTLEEDNRYQVLWVMRCVTDLRVLSRVVCSLAFSEGRIELSAAYLSATRRVSDAARSFHSLGSSAVLLTHNFSALEALVSTRIAPEFKLDDVVKLGGAGSHAEVVAKLRAIELPPMSINNRLERDYAFRGGSRGRKGKTKYRRN